MHFELTLEHAQPFTKKWPIHPCFLLRWITAREVANVLEASWTGRFSNHKHRIGILSPKAFDAAIPVNHTLLCFPSKQYLPRKCKDFDGSTLRNRPNSSAWKMSFSRYLANIVGNVISSQGAVISLATFYDSPRTSLKVYKEKMKDVVHLVLFWFKLQIKTQGKYHLPFFPASQPSVRWCKIVVIEGFRKFMSFLQKNMTIDWNVFTTYSCKLLQQCFI